MKNAALHRDSQLYRPAGFTLIELLVSMAILAMIVTLMVSMIGQTTSIWRSTTGKVEQFREAREGYESLTRKLSQATLNTYWDYDNLTKPTKYIRKAELQFRSGRELAMDSRELVMRPTHAVFFNAPLGFVKSANANTNVKPYEGLDYLINSWGYFIQYGSDADFKPPFVKMPDRYRFRLYESMIPSQEVNIYDPNRTLDWVFGKGGGTGFTNINTHVVAENIIALMVLPKLSKADIAQWNTLTGTNKYDDTSLVSATSYGYDTRNKKTDPRLNTFNQLPPIVQVCMVAIDEGSATRMSAADNQELVSKLRELFKEPAKLDHDLNGDPKDGDESLTEFLVRKRINYRVFTSDVPIRGAKWSTEQSN